MLKKVSIKKKDKVMVTTGKDKGKTGIVLEINRDKERALVEGINMVKKHAKANQQTGSQGGIEEREALISLSNLMVVCPECGKHTRTAKKILNDGKKVRVCKKCSGMIDK